MTTCILVAAVITCTNAGPRPSPEDAVKTFTASSGQRFAPMPAPDPARNVVVPLPADHPGEGWTSEYARVRPLAPPWEATTYYGHRGPVTLFNGEPMYGTPNRLGDGSAKGARTPHGREEGPR